MNTIKNNFKYIFILILLMILVSYFPVTSSDWVLFSMNNSIKTNISYVSLLTSLIIGESLIFKSLFVSSLILLMSIMLKNIHNKKNNTLIYMGLSLLFLTTSKVMIPSLISITGFTTNIIPTIFTLIIMNYILKDSLYRIKKPLLVTLGVLSSIWSFTSSLAISLLLLIIYLDKKLSDEKDENLKILTTSSILTTISLFIFTNIKVVTQTEIISSLTPSLISSNQIVNIMLTIFAFHFALKPFKTYTLKNKILTIISLLLITAFTTIEFININEYVKYISFILYNISIVFTLYNGTNSTSFKNMIVINYVYKTIYLIIISLFTTSYNSYILPITILDISLVLGCTNYLLPKNFLPKVWYMVMAAFIVIETYMDAKLLSRVQEIDRYTEYGLSCNYDIIEIPSKYFNGDYYYFIPKTIDQYIDYSYYLTYKYDKEYIIRID